MTACAAPLLRIRSGSAGASDQPGRRLSDLRQAKARPSGLSGVLEFSGRRLGRRTHGEPAVGASRSSFLEHGHGARLVARFPVRLGDIAIDHRGRASLVRDVRPPDRFLGEAEASFTRHGVATQDLVFGQAPVGECQRAAIDRQTRSNTGRDANRGRRPSPPGWRPSGGRRLATPRSLQPDRRGVCSRMRPGRARRPSAPTTS